MKELMTFQEHRFKAPLAFYSVPQMDLSLSLGISQSLLSRMLSGKAPMPPRVEIEIQELLNHLGAKKDRKIKPIPTQGK
jgi:hypothetical protein